MPGKLKSRLAVSLAAGMLLAGVLTMSYPQSSTTPSLATEVPPATITLVPLENPPREFRDGYDMVEQATLIQWAQLYIGIIDRQLRDPDAIEIEEETFYYTKGGYWRWTAASRRFLSDPDYPLFVYTVKGKLGHVLPSLGGGGGVSFDPRPTPTPELMTEVTVVMDPLIGRPIWHILKYLPDLAADTLDESQRPSTLMPSAMVEQRPNTATPEPEATREVTSLPSPASISTKSANHLSMTLTAMPTPPRHFKHGYDRITKAALVRIARDITTEPSGSPWCTTQDYFPIVIEEEKYFFVGAGYWRDTALRPGYVIGDPNYPIFIYSVRGILGCPTISLSPPSSSPNAPTPVPQAPTSRTVVIDAATGYVLQSGPEFLEDLSGRILDEAGRQRILGSVMVNEQGFIIVTPQPESTRDDLPPTATPRP